jgi:hypothetical protein
MIKGLKAPENIKLLSNSLIIKKIIKISIYIFLFYLNNYLIGYCIVFSSLLKIIIFLDLNLV